MRQPDRQQHQYRVGQTHGAAGRSKAGRSPKRAPRRNGSQGDQGRRGGFAAAAGRAEPAPGSTDPIKPNPVKTFTVQPGAMRTASLSPLPSDRPQAGAGGRLPTKVTTVIVKRESPPPPARQTGRARRAAGQGRLGRRQRAGRGRHAASRRPKRARRLDDPGRRLPRGEGSQATAGRGARTRPKTSSARPTRSPNGWRRATSRSIAHALPAWTKDQAETACKHLKRSEIPCMLLKN